MKKSSMELWKDAEFISLGDHLDLTANSLGMVPLVKDLLTKASGHLSFFKEAGYIKPKLYTETNTTPSELYLAHMTGLGGRLIYKHIDKYGDNTIHMWKDGVIQMNISGEYVSVNGLSHDENFIREMKNFFSSQWAKPTKKGAIYCIVKQGPHLSLSSIGNAGIPLVSGNYTQKVMEDYRFAIKDLKSENPSGRIVVMRGPAGTGKTHLIRALLLEVPDAMFVLISPEVIVNLAGPELLPLLMNYRGGTTGPIILVIEDADKCLVARATENMSSIQSLLNLGDGILGSMLDIRIIATTNADELKMETAILRPGRLSKMMEVGSLDAATAQGIFSRLLPDVSMPIELTSQEDDKPFEMSLAQVYSVARKNGWEPPARSVKVAEIDDDLDDDENLDD